MKILILGGSGFIGKNLINILIKNNYKVTGTYYKSNIKKLNKSVSWIKKDLRIYKNLENLFDKYEIIINCAAITSGAKEINEKPLKHLYDNLLINTNIAYALSTTYNKKYIFISSSVVYPECKRKMLEDDVTGNFSKVYEVVGTMKYYSENIYKLTAENSVLNKLNIIIIRPSNLYGPFDKFEDEVSKVIPSLIKKMIKSKSSVEIWGNGKQSRDFLYIEDFVESLLLIIKNKNNNLSYTIYNISSNTNISISKLAKIIKSKTNKQLDLIYKDKMPTTINSRKISSAKFISDYGVFAKTNLNEGLLKTINWYKINHI